VPERTRLYRFNFEMNFKTEFSWSVKQWSDSPTDQQCTCVTFKRPLPARHTTVLSIFTLCSNRCWRCLYQMNELFLSLHYKRDPLTAAEIKVTTSRAYVNYKHPGLWGKQMLLIYGSGNTSLMSVAEPVIYIEWHYRSVSWTLSFTAYGWTLSEILQINYNV